MKALYYWSLLLVIPISLNGQQFSPRTHFYENRLAYNPAVAGSEIEIPVQLNFRQQWTGLDNAPSTQTFITHAYTGKDVGLGLVIYNDVSGPSRNTGFQIPIAKHFALDRSGTRWFSFGMSLILYQFRFDIDRLETYYPNDPAVVALSKQNSRLTPDAAAGFYLSNENGFIGISCSNLLQTKEDLFDKAYNPNTIERAYYLLAGYRWPLNAISSFEPMAEIKLTESRSWQGNIMARFNYLDYWGGLIYRTQDAVALALGLRKEFISFSYSYDYPISDIGQFNNGTHEITATVHIFNPLSRLGPQRKKPERRHTPHMARNRRF